jgi:hypothetical protein
MRATRRQALGLIGLLSLPLAGCTVIGLLVGAHHDKNATPRPIPPLQVVSLDKGSNVELELRDGSLVAGRFDGLEPVPDARYRERWKESLQQLAPTTAVPGLGAARLRTNSGGDAEVTLLGLRPAGLSIREGGSATLGAVPFASIASLGVPGGGSIDGSALARLAQEDRLPFLDAAAVKTKGGARQVVPLENVRTTSIRGHSGKLTGVLVGAVIDVALVAVAAHSMSNMYGESGSSCRSDDPYCTSCPLVYSDGAFGLRLDAEPLGGSLFAADEAKDRALLAHLRARDGAYRVQIRNEMRETEELDAVRLLVVDHPDGAEVVPAMDGSLYLLREPAAARRAKDATGANLAPLLARDDERSWVEAPIGRDPDDPASRRASAVLEFDRPRGAASAALLVAVRATDWGVALFGHVLGLQGRELPAFWNRLEADAEARRGFRAAWAREALPRVAVETRHGWREAGTLAHIPLQVTGRRVVPLDLRDVEGETLRVRIEALPGLWAIGRVGVDYDARPASAARALRPRSARAEAQGDALERLMASDDRRLTLAAGSGRVDLEFDAPAPVTGAARSVLIELEGYYRPLVPAGGEPQQALFERLVHEPGALARYALAGVGAETAARVAELQAPR